MANMLKPYLNPVTIIEARVSGGLYERTTHLLVDSSGSPRQVRIDAPQTQLLLPKNSKAALLLAVYSSDLKKDSQKQGLQIGPTFRLERGFGVVIKIIPVERLKAYLVIESAGLFVVSLVESYQKQIQVGDAVSFSNVYCSTVLLESLDWMPPFANDVRIVNTYNMDGEPTRAFIRFNTIEKVVALDSWIQDRQVLQDPSCQVILASTGLNNIMRVTEREPSEKILLANKPVKMTQYALHEQGQQPPVFPEAYTIESVIGVVQKVIENAGPGQLVLVECHGLKVLVLDKKKIAKTGEYVQLTHFELWKVLVSSENANDLQPSGLVELV